MSCSNTPPTPTIDWTLGSVHLQDGYVYVSPNCRRDVSISPGIRPSRLTEDFWMDIADYKQPVWWNDNDGWMSFIPLCPSFLSNPFEPLCWMPRFEKIVDCAGNVALHRMRLEDGTKWMDIEAKLEETILKLRMLFKTPGRIPPLPSATFEYTAPHQHLDRVKAAVEKARDWFVIWMGSMSYHITQTELTIMFKDSDLGAGPLWYQKLHQADSHKWSEAWLDGILGSSVCKFDAIVPRAGIVFHCTQHDATRPPIKWFLRHNIPVFYPWTMTEEEATSIDYSVKCLEPPAAMLQQALTLLFKTPSIPMAALVLRNFYIRTDTDSTHIGQFLRLHHATSLVKDTLRNIHNEQYQDSLLVLEKGSEVLDVEVAQVLRDELDQVKSKARRGADLPTQGMVEFYPEEHWGARGRLVEDVHEYFAQREKHIAELIAVQPTELAQSRLDREKNPSIVKSDIFKWEKIQTSGGKILYLSLRVPKKYNSEEHARYASTQRIFSAYLNQWDLCRFIDEDAPTPIDDNYDDEEGMEYICGGAPTSVAPTFVPSNGELSQAARLLCQCPRTLTIPNDYDASCCHADLLPRSVTQIFHSRMQSSTSACNLEPHAMDVDEGYEGEMTRLFRNEQEQYEKMGWKLDRWEDRDMIDYFTLGYGYVPPLSEGNLLDTSKCELLVRNSGFEARSFSLRETKVPMYLFHSLDIFYRAMSGKKRMEETIPSDLYDLDPSNRISLEHTVDFRIIHRPISNLFVFSEPRSLAVNWLLGVESPEIALYVLRYGRSNPKHTIMTIASCLISRCIACRTLVGVKTSPRLPDPVTIVESYRPRRFRANDHVFNVEDFKSWQRQCKEFLIQPRGRAASLKGGIVGRIAAEYLGIDSVLAGPSFELMNCQAGFIAASGTLGTVYGDDELTQDDLAYICGAYSMYDEQRKQYTVKYWFPPHGVWNNPKSGVTWIEWTERNEGWFLGLLGKYKAGEAQLRTAEQWSSSVRGHSVSRFLITNNKERARAFWDRISPPSAIPSLSLTVPAK